ncbi:UPF0158 family protein [Pengzhenrongella phosphoraccumulans]|uniref:UPF0158 family protein n=1 Tax=Pengzhenrongella phosphoraccumulans TaxID=3114394 RepID=UPI003890F2A4
MNHGEERAELRVAIYRGDADSLVGILKRQEWPEDALQLIGDGLLRVLPAPTGGIDEAAHRCVAALQGRGWEGDADLAASLEAALGSGPIPMLRPLPVDLEELAGVLEGDPVNGGGRIDRRTGQVWPQPAIEYAEELGDIEDDDDAERWLWVECEGSRAGYRDMELFIATLNDTDQVDQLGRAIGGRGAFRRFKDQLSTRPELLDRWHAFSEDRQRGRARAWLAAEGYAPAPPPQES